MDSPLEGQDRTSASCVVLFFWVRSGEWAKPILRTFLQKSYSPRELRKAKFSPPDYTTSKQMSGIAPAASGSRVPLSSALTTDSVGVQRGSHLTLFAGNPKTRRFLARLSSISSRQEMDRGCGPRRPTIDLIKGSEKEQCFFSCPYYLKFDFAESLCAVFAGTFLQKGIQGRLSL